jgi:hypothetical protein
MAAAMTEKEIIALLSRGKFSHLLGAHAIWDFRASRAGAASLAQA